MFPGPLGMGSSTSESPVDAPEKSPRLGATPGPHLSTSLQVRSNAEATLTALNQTLTILDRVAEAVAIARRVGKADAEVRRDAAAAMAAALNATTSSALALSITQQVGIFFRQPFTCAGCASTVARAHTQ